jgi:hypothetical protein
LLLTQLPKLLLLLPKRLLLPLLKRLLLLLLRSLLLPLKRQNTSMPRKQKLLLPLQTLLPSNSFRNVSEKRRLGAVFFSSRRDVSRKGYLSVGLLRQVVSECFNPGEAPSHQIVFSEGFTLHSRMK